ncbi:MAG: ribosome biogenesis GTPase Der [Patescibacteria group bacterium]|jgi:GTP-binding protein
MNNVFAIIGRPNAGKSTFFNRLIGSREAIIANEPGTTRDFKFGYCQWEGKEIEVIDTGGFEFKTTDDIFGKHIFKQINSALVVADNIFFLVDLKDGIKNEDLEIAKILRATDKNVILVGNKIDSSKIKDLETLKKLGFNQIFAISAQKGRGMSELLDYVVKNISDASEREINIKVALIGRPNVGKSSLLNALVDSDRVIVSDKPGTTRDMIDVPFVYKDKKFLFIDTAGIRKRGRIVPGVEKFSVERSIRAIDRARLVILVVDAAEGITRGDAHLAQYCINKNKPILVAYNKMDLVENEVDARFQFLSKLESVFISASKKLNLEEILEWLSQKS